jgi:hypothetical protein
MPVMAYEARRQQRRSAALRAPAGHAAPGHALADAKLKIREWRIGLGMPPGGSSPEAQQECGLNRDETLHPARGEGEKLRK